MLRKMLQRLRQHKDVGYVIVYDLSRLARNRLDDAVLSAALAAEGVELVSTKEHIDNTPGGQLTHGLLAVVNEYRSISDGLDIAYKMGQKVKHGGTVNRVSLGYLNVGERLEDGREVRSVAFDPEREHHARQVFVLFATGKYSFEEVATLLAAQGFTTRRSPSHPSRPVDGATIGLMLRNPYYIGRVVYNGVAHQGRHPHLVSKRLFDKVQAIIASRHRSGERRRLHPHHLIGSLYCGRCLQEGREPYRMLFNHTINHSGRPYDYFFCRGRQEGACTAPFIPAKTVEQDVLRLWKATRLPGKLTKRLTTKLQGTTAGSAVNQLGRVYANANPATRRLLNQSMFGKIYVMSQGGVTAESQA